MIKMNFKVKKNTALLHIKDMAKRSRDAGQGAAFAGAAVILAEAVKRCPVNTGTLQASGYIAPQKPSYSKIIGFGVNYAAKVHEWPAKVHLGPRSLQKQAHYGITVGRKYLSRAISENRDKIKDAVKRVYRNLGGR